MWSPVPSTRFCAPFTIRLAFQWLGSIVPANYVAGRLASILEHSFPILPHVVRSVYILVRSTRSYSIHLRSYTCDFFLLSNKWLHSVVRWQSFNNTWINISLTYPIELELLHLGVSSHNSWHAEYGPISLIRLDGLHTDYCLSFDSTPNVFFLPTVLPTLTSHSFFHTILVHAPGYPSSPNQCLFRHPDGPLVPLPF